MTKTEGKKSRNYVEDKKLHGLACLKEFEVNNLNDKNAFVNTNLISNPSTYSTKQDAITSKELAESNLSTVVKDLENKLSKKPLKSTKFQIQKSQGNQSLGVVKKSIDQQDMPTLNRPSKNPPKPTYGSKVGSFTTYFSKIFDTKKKLVNSKPNMTNSKPSISPIMSKAKCGQIPTSPKHSQPNCTILKPKQSKKSCSCANKSKLRLNFCIIS